MFKMSRSISVNSLVQKRNTCMYLDFRYLFLLYFQNVLHYQTVFSTGQPEAKHNITYLCIFFYIGLKNPSQISCFLLVCKFFVLHRNRMDVLEKLICEFLHSLIKDRKSTFIVNMFVYKQYLGKQVNEMIMRVFFVSEIVTYFIH